MDLKWISHDVLKQLKIWGCALLCNIGRSDAMLIFKLYKKPYHRIVLLYEEFGRSNDVKMSSMTEQSTLFYVLIV